MTIVVMVTIVTTSNGNNSTNANSNNDNSSRENSVVALGKNSASTTSCLCDLGQITFSFLHL